MKEIILTREIRNLKSKYYAGHTIKSKRDNNICRQSYILGDVIAIFFHIHRQLYRVMNLLFHIDYVKQIRIHNFDFCSSSKFPIFISLYSLSPLLIKIILKCFLYSHGLF